jgi:hypothetical protein
MEFCDGGDLQRLIKRFKNKNDTIGEDFIWKIFS